jgi:hypothetical protein
MTDEVSSYFVTFNDKALYAGKKNLDITVHT